MRRTRRSAVTLSGLLNILDGVGSEEGKIFFATVSRLFPFSVNSDPEAVLQTNYVDNLDAALLRPGRIDRKVEYKLATSEQASALFDRFYPPNHVTPEPLLSSDEVIREEQKVTVLEQLNKQFTASIPAHEFSIADLQGYLLSCKMMPEKAAKGISDWVASERMQKQGKQDRLDAKKRRQAEKTEKMEVERFQKTLTKLNGPVGPGLLQDKLANGETKTVDVPVPPTVKKPLNGSAFVAPPTVGWQVNGMIDTAAASDMGDAVSMTTQGSGGLEESL
jgi:chaperone BCS1